MPRKVKQSKSLFSPLAENFMQRISNADGRFRKRLMWVAVALIVGLSGWSIMSGEFGIPRIVRLEMQKKALVEANRQLYAELVDAERIKLLLQTDKRYIEMIARTKYHMVYPNETLYKFNK